MAKKVFWPRRLQRLDAANKRATPEIGATPMLRQERDWRREEILAGRPERYGRHYPASLYDGLDYLFVWRDKMI